MKNTAKKFLKIKGLPIAMLIFALISCIIMYACRFVWVFVDTAVNFKLTIIVFAIIILNAFVLGAMAYLQLNCKAATDKNGIELLWVSRYP